MTFNQIPGYRFGIDLGRCLRGGVAETAVREAGGGGGGTS